MQRHNIRYICLIASLLVLCLLPSCKNQAKDKKVLALWDLTADNPACQLWERDLKQAFQMRGIPIELQNIYCYQHDEGLSVSTERIGSLLREMADNGYTPDLILVRSDIAFNMLCQSGATKLADYPLIAFGLSHSPTDSLSLPFRKQNSVFIVDHINIEKNLELMNEIFPKQSRFVTVLDPEKNPTDLLLKNVLMRQMARFNPDIYLNNIDCHLTKSEFTEACDSGLIGMFALSAWSTSDNSDKGYDPTKDLFYKLSANRAIFFKQDHITKFLAENPETDLFFSTKAEYIDIYDNCVGGYMCTTGLASMDVATRADELFSGVYADEPATFAHSQNYFVNWQAIKTIRKASSLPENYIIRGIDFDERYPVLWIFLSISLALLGFGITAYFISKILKTFRTNREVRKAEMESANKFIGIKQGLDFLLQHTNAYTWRFTTDNYVIFENPVRKVSLTERLQEIDPFYRQKLSDVFMASEPGLYEAQYFGTVVPDGEKHWFEMRLFVSQLPNGEIEKNGFTISIDKIKEMEAGVVESQRLLANAQEKNRFISAMSHEMRTPLNSIVGFAQLITTPGFVIQEDEREIMQEAVEQSGAELMKIIEDMLTLTHIDNSTLRMKVKPYLVDDLINHVLRKMREEFNTHNTRLVVNEGIETSMINVDKNIFTIILENIIGNALKFSDKGSELTIGWSDKASTVHIFVRDRGIGMDKQQQMLAFHRFYQADPFSQGTGLGLSVAKEYAERMGGKIECQSELGKGSTFTVIFERYEAEDIQ